MATHSSILAWRVPWTEEPGGLQSLGVTEGQPLVVGCTAYPRMVSSHPILYLLDTRIPPLFQVC